MSNTNQAKKHGNKKGKKDKKRNKSNSNVNPPNPPIRQPDADASTNTKASYSDQLRCELCDTEDEIVRWFVQCDACDKHFHFDCVGIVEIQEEEPWLCPKCHTDQSKLSVQHKSTKTGSEGESLDSTPPERTIQIADVHAPFQPILEDLSESTEDIVNKTSTNGNHNTNPSASSQDPSRLNRNGASQVAHRLGRAWNSDIIEIEDASKEISKASAAVADAQSQVLGGSKQTTSTRVASLKSMNQNQSNRTKSQRSSIRSTITSSSRDLQRIQDEVSLQTKLDEETLALKLEALRLKEEALIQKGLLEKKLLKEKYRASSSSKGSKSSKSSVTTTRSSDNSKKSYVSGWIEDQKNLKGAMSLDGHMDDRADKLNVDLSIPLDKGEREMLLQNRNTDVPSIQTKLVWNPSRPAQNARVTLDENFVNSKKSQPIISINSDPSKLSHPKIQASRQGPPMPTGEAWYQQMMGNQFRPVSTQYPPDQTCVQPTSRSTLVYSQTMSAKPQTGVGQSTHNPVVSSRTTNPSNRDTVNGQRDTGEWGEVYDETGQFMGRARIMPNQQVRLFAPNSGRTDDSDQNQPHQQPRGRSNQQEPNQQFNGQNSQSSTQNCIATYQQMPTYGQPENEFPTYNVSQWGQPREPLTASQIAARHATPKDLPHFYGNPNEWPRFIRRVINSTAMCGYGDDENLERLDKSIKGNARNIIESLLLMPNCVPEILQTLFEKFGRPELVIKAILADIRRENVIKADKLEALSNFGYKVRNACNQIESLKLHNYLYNPELIQEIIEKLPYQTRIDWSRHAENLPEITLKTLADWLHSLARTINRVITPEITTNSSDNKNSNDRKNIGERKPEKKSEPPKGGFLNVHDEGKSRHTSEKKITCEMCSKECKNFGECEQFKSASVDERWKFVLRTKACRTCLKKHRRACHDAKACGVSGCKIKHHPLLHNVERHSERNETNSKKEVTRVVSSSSEVDATKGRCHTHSVDSSEASFRILPVVLHHKGCSVKTFAFLDEGSSFTLLERHIAEQLGLKGIPETICMIWTKQIHREEESEHTELEISGENVQGTKHLMKGVNIVDDLNLPPQSLSPKDLTRKYEHLRGLPLQGFKNAIPTIMIGVKHARLSTPLETIEGGVDDPIATRSRLGWAVHGPMNENNETETKGYVNSHRVSRCPCKDREEDLHQMVKAHFSIENFGVSASSMSVESKDNEKALELLEKFTLRKENRFETRLLWKNDSYILPDSYGMALKRLNCLENKGPAIIKTINEFIEDYMNKGYVSKLSPDKIDKKHPRQFYLPLFTVANPKKPEKIRPVFDAAATVKGVSLNSVLLTGPDLLSPIADMLRRFRENRIAVCGDIKEMYHQVGINEEDRHSQRFLWRNGEKDREPDVYVMNVMTFGATCSPSAAQFVKNLNASEFKDKFPRAAEAIIKNHYVDDMMDGMDSIDEAIQLVHDVKFVHSKAGFEIRNFKSNSKEVLKAIGEKVDNDKKRCVADDTNLERVLGMFWDTSTDCLTFSLKFTKVTSDILTRKVLPTKKELLRLLMSIYDPLGLLSYYLIHLKILLQDVWRSKIGWNDQLPIELREHWDRWIEILPSVETLQIPRWYSEKLSPKLDKKVELHVFVDAGGEAFSAVAYLRIEDDEGCDCSLIGSKARVTPLKYLSTPRKELMGGVLGSRLVNSVGNSLSIKIDRRVIWTDSATVLIWLHSEHRKYSQFVAHRVGEILETTNLDEWRWVPSKSNVADEATKWSKTPTFAITDRWFTGPEFLKLPESEWPEQKAIQANGTREEMKLSCSHSKLIKPSIIDPNRFSQWKRMLRALARAIRCSKIIYAKAKRLNPPSGPLIQEELIDAEQRLFRQAQWEGFTEEMITLLRNKKLDQTRQKSISKESSIKDCLPYLDEYGILRVRGRIDAAEAVTMDAKRPIILPRNHQITKLIVNDYHQEFAHQNHETVVNELKQRFYIPQIRTVLKGVRWSCKVCEIRRCRPKTPQMADLPAIRFQAGIRAFTYTGIDYFGPMYVKIGRSYHKRWGVLFTCMTIRAVHIEIAHSLRTDSCIMVIRDFMARRGKPLELYSDNGSNLRGADNELKKEMEKLDFDRLSTEFTSRYIKWTFIPPASPNMGGCWERLIRTVKSCLKQSLPTRTPDDEVLRNLLMETENILNSRPLTFVPLDTEEAEALTPNHFLLGTSSGLKPPGKFRNDGPYLRECWKEVQRCSDVFWERFILEYIPTLTRRTKWFDEVKPLEIGDIVINFDETALRNTYTRARIVETRVGSKGQVRRAKIQPADGSAYWRPASKLGVLDVSSSAPTTRQGLDLEETIETGANNVGASFSTSNSCAAVKSIAPGSESEISRSNTKSSISDSSKGKSHSELEGKRTNFEQNRKL